MRYAVLVKHFMRSSWDTRVDIYTVPPETTVEELMEHVRSNLLGPFEVVCITDRISEQTWHPVEKKE